MSMYALSNSKPMEELLRLNRDDQVTQAARLSSLSSKKCLFISAPCVKGMSEAMKCSIQWINDQGVDITAVFNSEKDELYKIFFGKEFDEGFFVC